MAVASDLPAAREPPAVQATQATRSCSTYHGTQLGDPHRTTRTACSSPADQIAPAMKHAIDRDRGQALLPEPRRRHRAASAARSRRRRRRRRRPGRLDDHPAVRQERARGAGQAHRVREAARGGAGLPPHAQVVEGEDPHRVPQRDLLRQRRVRDRVGRARRTSATPRSDAGGCGTTRANMCASELTPAEAALLRRRSIAVAERLRPGRAPARVAARRNIVLRHMREQGYITPARVLQDVQARRCRPRNDLDAARRREPGAATSRPGSASRCVDRFGAAQGRSSGGLQITTTLDLDFQKRRAERRSAGGWPTRPGRRAVTRGDRQPTGEVRAMVGGPDYATSPFNLATQGQRQPGSTFKPFMLAAALESGICPASVWSSRPSSSSSRTGGQEKLRRQKLRERVLGLEARWRARRRSPTTPSSQRSASESGRTRSRTAARRMGIRTPISTNYAMMLGGLKQGVTPLDMAHAYETFADRRQAHRPARSARPTRQARSGIQRSRAPAATAAARRKHRADNRVHAAGAPAASPTR